MKLMTVIQLTGLEKPRFQCKL